MLFLPMCEGTPKQHQPALWPAAAATGLQPPDSHPQELWKTAKPQVLLCKWQPVEGPASLLLKALTRVSGPVRQPLPAGRGGVTSWRPQSPVLEGACCEGCTWIKVSHGVVESHVPVVLHNSKKGTFGNISQVLGGMQLCGIITRTGKVYSLALKRRACVCNFQQVLPDL